MCLYPRLIKNPKYKENKKNGGVIPAVTDPRVLYVPIGCDNCIECRKAKSRNWQVRLQEDIRHNTNGKFITLTFSNESIKNIICEAKLQDLEGYKLDNAIATWAVRHWLERWRKKYGKSLRHWLVTELGHNGTENIHLHGIIWTDEEMKNLKTTWQYGFVWTGKGDKKENYVNIKTVNYIVKYITKVNFQHKYYKSIILTSPGIGAGYMKRTDKNNNKFNEDKTRDTYKTRSGHEMALPIYYRNKLYTDEEKEKLWLHKLNKNERWIMGIKVPADDSKQIHKLQEYYREINIKMGYRGSYHDWDQITYENNRRILLQQTRIANAQAN